MANSETDRPTVSALLDPPSQPIHTKKSGFYRSKSAPTHAPTHLPPPKRNWEINILKSRFKKFHPSFRQVLLVLVVYLGMGTLCFFFFKDHLKGDKTNRTLDAIYFCIVTMTTVGYGDIVPNSVPTKLLACAFVFGGMAIVGLVLGKAADYLVEKQEAMLVKSFRGQEADDVQVLKEIKTYKVRYKLVTVVVVLLLLMIVGTVFLTTVEGLSFVDSFYCVCTTITTLGYGDKSFSTVPGRIFAVFWILASTLFLAQFFLYLAEMKSESKQQELVSWVLERKMTGTDIEQADIDNDGAVSAPEFIIFKLKEMGKISAEDIALVMDEFNRLDVDHTGSLSKSDILLMQSPQTQNGLSPSKSELVITSE